MAFLGLARQARTVEKQGNTTHPQVDIMWLIGTKPNTWCVRCKDSHLCVMMSDPELVGSNPGKPGSCPNFRPPFQDYLTVTPAQVPAHAPADLGRRNDGAESESMTIRQRRTERPHSPELPDSGGHSAPSRSSVNRLIRHCDVM